MICKGIFPPIGAIVNCPSWTTSTFFFFFLWMKPFILHDEYICIYIKRIRTYLPLAFTSYATLHRSEDNELHNLAIRHNF